MSGDREDGYGKAKMRYSESNSKYGTQSTYELSQGEGRLLGETPTLIPSFP
jgi:hypothetical protein